jgi:hypothetical protein
MKSNGGRAGKRLLRSNRLGKKAKESWRRCCELTWYCSWCAKLIFPLRKAVGGSTSTGASNTSPEELARELETFDMKVYKAQTQMVREMNGKLRSLGVPFFGTKSELVRTSGKTESGQNVANGPGVEKTVIDESDLVELQKRMLTILEDLCND